MGTAAVTVINSGDPLDPAVVDANFAAVLAELNGNLQAITNIQIASAVAINGNANTAGSSSALAASDHTHIVRGLENLTTDPTTGNFVGRTWFDTSTSQWKGISDLSGPTIAVLGNPSAADLVHHASQHVDGAADELADTSIAERSMKSRTVASATLASDIGFLSANAWTTVVDLPVTTTGVQTLDVKVNVAVLNSNGSTKPLVALRVVDVTAGSTTIWRSPCAQQIGVSGGGSDQFALTGSFHYTVPATGARTLRVQINSDTGSSSIKAKLTATINTDTAVPPTISAVIL